VKYLNFLIAAILVIGGNVKASEGKISGTVYSDYYYAAAHHDSEIEGANGFWFRRIYLTYDQGLEENFAIRLRFEMNSPGDFTSSSKLTPVVKDAYLKWKHNRHNVIVGISGTPTWGLVEKVWGYRSVAKTPLDLHKYGSSRDFGVAFKGNLDSEKRFGYHLMLGNGNSNKSETNTGKKVLLSLSGKLPGGFVLEGYADYDERPGHTSRYTLQGFAAYQTKSFRAGAQFAHQNRQMGSDEDDIQLRIASVFAASKLSEKVRAFGRVDRLLDANPSGGKISYLPFDSSAKAYHLLAGVDFSPVSNVQVIPNIQIVYYDEVDGERPDTSVIPRITLAYKWKKTVN
jgi:hypothetical protein